MRLRHFRIVLLPLSLVLCDSMKYFTATLFLILVSFCVVAEECKVIFSNDQFQLCVEESLGDSSIPLAYFDVYAIHRLTNEKTFISRELVIDDVSNVTQVNKREYFYKAFIGVFEN